MSSDFIKKVKEEISKFPNWGDERASEWFECGLDGDNLAQSEKDLIFASRLATIKEIKTKLESSMFMVDSDIFRYLDSLLGEK